MFHFEDAGQGVTLLRMDDEKVNAIGPEFVQGFPNALKRAAEEGGALVLTGNAHAFSAGLDLQTLPGLDLEELRDFFLGFNASLEALLAHPEPVVAAVDGPAMAGGAILALASDLRIAGPTASMGVVEVRVAVPFPPPVLTLVRERLPAHEQGPAILEGKVRQGDDLVARGWVHERHEAAVARAVERAGTLAQYDAPTVQATKRALNADLVEAVARFGDQVDAYLEHFQAPGALEAIQEGFARMRKAR
ncbi:MAG: enoyl-CoA hydratase/isomerase family protein [Candidatus Thermoplasmatota archaeon]|nr:enoyl-CoA hydratase/isomerase family protein [Candidatus Thermoplasmatota archaeon]